MGEEMMSYYDRKPQAGPGGTVMYTTEEDRANEAAAKALIEAKWECELFHFGIYAPIDWYATRNGGLASVIEFKAFTHGQDEYAHVWLNVRKWLALQLASIGLGIPAFYVVRFTDAMMYIKVTDIDASNHKMGGTKKRVKSVTDIEPVICIPVSYMRKFNAPVALAAVASSADPQPIEQSHQSHHQSELSTPSETTEALSDQDLPE
jgi:hypothetical protein